MAKKSTILKMQKNDAERGSLKLQEETERVATEILDLDSRIKSLQDAKSKLIERQGLLTTAKAEHADQLKTVDKAIKDAELEESKA